MVHCGGAPDRPGLPTLVVEVLSPSNGATELMTKLHAYRSVDGIADILLLEQDAYLADHFTRTDSGLWTGPTPCRVPMPCWPCRGSLVSGGWRSFTATSEAARSRRSRRRRRTIPPSPGWHAAARADSSTPGC